LIVPSYWAEAKAWNGQKRGSVTVRRFGWSNTSQEEAQKNADARAAEALARIVAGEKDLRRREPKIAYNGAEGVPIREEVLARHRESVITRNAYGAHCLNTPNVLFADIDFDDEPDGVHYKGAFGVVVCIAAALGYVMSSWGWFFFGVVVGGIIFTSALAWLLYKLKTAVHGQPERVANKRIASFIAAHSDWSLRRYRTPKGFRIIAQHREFDPREPAVREFFGALGVDSLYRDMCFNQNCFRARLTGKPWRMGISGHMRPRPGVWPVKPDRMAVRSEWIAKYEAKALEFAACRYVDTLGVDLADSRVAWVVSLHDRESRALTELPIA
jgi:hypothetical protein